MLDKNDPRIKWFEEARFGLFIHWGLYSAAEGYWNGKETKGIGEWIQAREQIPIAEYEKLAEKLSCDQFDPKLWAKLAKRAGMSYCVFTSKHHDGFAMFDTDFDDYSIAKRSPYGKDAVAVVVEAMRAEGIKPCLYYSQAHDWHEPNATGNTWDFQKPENERNMWEFINGKCKFQLQEILTRYGDLSLIWMDVPKGLTDEMAMEIRNFVHDLQPECLVSGRISYNGSIGDYGCYGDNQIPAGRPSGCWETAATMNHSWGYKRNDHNFKSPKELLELLCSLMGKGTNLLLNIGPKPDGSLTKETLDILEKLGDWYEINGEAIQGTEGSPFDCEVSFGTVSQKGNILYLYIYEPQESIDLYGLQNQVQKVSVLGGGVLDFSQDRLLHIDMSKVVYNPYVTVVKVELDSEPIVKHGIRQQEKNLVILPAFGCEITQKVAAQAGGQLEGDAALEAENMNLAGVQNMEVDIAGILQNWRSEQNYLRWEFEVMESGEYDAYLYTLTRKYEPWVGGHKVHLSCGIAGESKVLKADCASRGANHKYFAETGSCIGTITLKEGKNVVALYADEINTADPVGLSVSRLELKRIGK